MPRRNRRRTVSGRAVGAKAKPEWVDGIRFASRREANRYRDLKLIERAGEISKLTVHPKFPFEINGQRVLIKSDGYPNGRQASYTADFSYNDHRTSKRIVEDSKGADTSASRLRRAIVTAQYGVEIVLI